MEECDTMNKANILKLADHIERLDPEEFNQRVFAHDCGTPACIAGHALALAGRWGGGVEGSTEDHPVGLAAKWLGIDKDTRALLFDSQPRGYATNYPTKEDAVATLRHLAETGDVVWRDAR